MSHDATILVTAGPESDYQDDNGIRLGQVPACYACFMRDRVVIMHRLEVCPVCAAKEADRGN